MSSKSSAPLEPTWTETLAKGLTPRSEWPDKDELLDVVYWGKQVISLLLGFIFGITSLTGVLVLVCYVGTSSVIAHHFVTKFQRVDEEEVGGFWELSKEGFGAAFATFMVTWITTYTYSTQV
ncbi:Rab5-interacting protein [Caenorhabditis elegans]|uniref:Rab5-interacting protein n=1 Tax=Caenorhabditis elegans TaxID=6239 RepID=O16254_CAEEL|nr:Rab5-interacting protein [Caenorhabditis elegans]CCD67868.1 Rab5-interacting protein [Caenorhabditis elegans]|eukprot:NP_504519.1 Uncharacterized protein CELE_F44E7.9 [Caenorhabditis elegans]